MIGLGGFDWLRVKVCLFPYTLKVVLTTLTLSCEVLYKNQAMEDSSPRSASERLNHDCLPLARALRNVQSDRTKLN